MEQRLHRIREKLILLTDTDTDFRIFGSKEPWNGHEYQLNPRLAEEDVSRFENHARVTLPAEYRLFLTSFADGGAGPYYGLLFLFAAADEVRSRARDGESREDWIASFSAFPVTQAQSDSYIHRIEQSQAGSRTDTSNTTVVFYEPDFPVDPISRKEPITGVLFLSEYGCGGYYVLVVQGVLFGQVWFWQVNEYLAPVCDSQGSIFSFFDWYEYWLDTSLQKLRVAATNEQRQNLF